MLPGVSAASRTPTQYRERLQLSTTPTPTAIPIRVPVSTSTSSTLASTSITFVTITCYLTFIKAKTDCVTCSLNRQADFGGRAVFGWTGSGLARTDDHGHGSHVAGIAAGTRYGVAKKANIISVKVLDAAGCVV